MRSFVFNFLNFCTENKLVIFLIIFLTFVAWHKILNQVFLGEGYYYFDEDLSFFTSYKNSPFLVFRYDLFARLLFHIFPPLLRDNIRAYMLLELFIIILLYISLYTVIVKITKSKLAGFSTVVFFLANYIGSFSLFAEGNYQRFIQRIPNLIPDIFSFYFLFKFYHGKRTKDYFISLALYIISLLMSHFSSIILPLFLIYPLVQLLQQNVTKKILLNRVITTLPFILITLLLTRGGDQAPTKSIFQFILTEPDLLQRTLYQIPLVTMPLDIVIFIAKHVPKPLSEPYTLIMPYLTITCLVFYIGGGFIIYKKRKGLLILYITSFLTMIASMFLYMYVDARINPLKYYGQDRFYFIPSLLAAICWGIILKVVFIKKQILHRIIPIFILSSFVIYNTLLISSNIDLIQYKSETLKSFIQYIKQRSVEFNNQTVIIVPSYLAWPAPLIIKYSVHSGISIKREFDGWENEYWRIKENVYVFDYEYDKNIDRTTHPNAGHMVDFTQKYRNGEKIQFLN